MLGAFELETPMPPLPDLSPEMTLAAQQQEDEARRQAQAGQTYIPDGLADITGAVADVANSGVVEVAGEVVGACLEGVATVAKVSLDVVGGILGGIGDL